MPIPRPLRFRALRLLGVVGAAFAAAGCGSTAPKPVVCNAAQCPPDAVFVLAERCAVPVSPGESCNTLFDVCSQGHACVGGTCQPAPVVLEDCQLGEPCAFAFRLGKETFCRDNPKCFPDSALPPKCSVYVELGDQCDSSWLSPECRPCAPGLNCTELGVCLKPCRTNADCPCDAAGETDYGCVDFGRDRQFCRPCRSLGQSCDPTLPCCTSGETCAGGACCRGTGAACSASGDCCGSDVCPGGKCRPCTKNGEACSGNGECCTGHCEQGSCATPCDEGEPCKLPGQKGVCAQGVTHCEGGRQTCVPIAASSPEVCNGLDDDCDGVVDNIPPADCSPATNVPSSCQGLVIEGRQQCRDSELVCHAAQGTDYCTICGGACGTCAATPCTPGATACIPNAVCAGSAGLEECKLDPVCPQPTPACWRPSDVKLPPAHCFVP